MPLAVLPIIQVKTVSISVINPATMFLPDPTTIPSEQLSVVGNSIVSGYSYVGGLKITGTYIRANSDTGLDIEVGARADGVGKDIRLYGGAGGGGLGNGGGTVWD